MNQDNTKTPFIVNFTSQPLEGSILPETIELLTNFSQHAPQLLELYSKTGTAIGAKVTGIYFSGIFPLTMYEKLSDESYCNFYKKGLIEISSWKDTLITTTIPLLDACNFTIHADSVNKLYRLPKKNDSYQPLEESLEYNSSFKVFLKFPKQVSFDNNQIELPLAMMNPFFIKASINGYIHT